MPRPSSKNMGQPRSTWRWIDGCVSTVTSSYMLALRFFGVYHWNERIGSSPRRPGSAPAIRPPEYLAGFAGSHAGDVAYGSARNIFGHGVGSRGELVVEDSSLVDAVAVGEQL